MKTFDEIPLHDNIYKALKDLKFEKPTETQSAVIPVALKGGDVMVCAETGSGKTAAYGIPIVSSLLANKKESALVLAPTRELAQQISDFLRDLVSHSRDIRVACIVGGADIRKQTRALKGGARLIVATPGRAIDHLKRKNLRLEKTNHLVLDEGDRMLDMGFSPQLDEILKFVPKKRQTSLFSATMPEKVKTLAKKYLSNPEVIQIGRGSLPVKSIQQSIVQLKMKEKENRIVDELNNRKGSIIVFMKTQRRTSKLAQFLNEYGFAVDQIHGGRTQGQRNMAIRNFKGGKSRILCATDIAARGIDVPQVEHVINFDLPMEEEDYVHRIGRTARNGAEGEALSFVTPEDYRYWAALAKKYEIKGVELEGVSKEALRSKPKAGGRKRRSFKKSPSRSGAGGGGFSARKRNGAGTSGKSSQGEEAGSSSSRRPGRSGSGGPSKRAANGGPKRRSGSGKPASRGGFKSRGGGGKSAPASSSAW